MTTSFMRQFVNPAILFEREDFSAAVLLVIDMQVDFLSRKGRLHVEQERVEGLISNVHGKTHNYRPLHSADGSRHRQRRFPVLQA